MKPASKRFYDLCECLDYLVSINEISQQNSDKFCQIYCEVGGQSSLNWIDKSIMEEEEMWYQSVGESLLKHFGEGYYYVWW